MMRLTIGSQNEDDDARLIVETRVYNTTGFGGLVFRQLWDQGVKRSKDEGLFLCFLDSQAPLKAGQIPALSYNSDLSLLSLENSTSLSLYLLFVLVFIMSVHNSENGDDYIEDPDLYDAMIELPKLVGNASESFKKHTQLLKLMQFLMGLDDSYMQIRSSILSRDVLPNVRSAYATISSKEWSCCWANQHMTYTDKELDNVLDISHLRIKVGHPNGTEAYISKIGNLKLSNGLTLYDVMVVPELLVYFDFMFINWLKYNKDSEIEKNDSTNAFQDVNNINFFDIEYPEIPNDDERVDNDLNRDKRSQSDSSSSSVSGSNHNTADFQLTILEMMLIAVGFRQKERIDYEETFSPVVKMVSIRCLLNIIVSMYWPVFQLDVNNAFLYGDLEEAPRQWNAKLTSTMIENGFSQSKSDYSLYTKSDKGVFLALLVYVDDIIITGNSVSEIEKFKVFLKSKFMIKDLGKFKYFLGIEVVDTDKGICLNQRKYVLDLLSEYGMLACKPAKNPLSSELVNSNKACDNDPLLENVTDYQRLMGKLIYLTNTRPDISYVVHCLSQFMHSPLTSHLKIAFKILRYLKSCPGLGIYVAKTSGMFLNAYYDVD
ncbi:ribonuclease H-like domain-containing protein [Tanacetum coccineum]